MSDTQHTPGSWEVSKDATPDYAPQFTIYAEDTGARVATVFETEANARLIAAAPDLLEAANLAVQYGLDEDPWWRPLRAAIAKAAVDDD